MAGTRQPGGHKEVIALTANTTLTNDDVGKIFTNRGAAGSVTVTLPAPDGINAGGSIDVYAVADQNVVVTTSDKMAIFNDAAADSVAVSTSGEKIGACFQFTSDGTVWFAKSLGVGAHTITTAT